MIIKIGFFWQPTVTSCLIAQLATTTTMRFSARPATPRTLDPRVTGSLGVLLVSLWTQAAGMRSPLSKVLFYSALYSDNGSFSILHVKMILFYGIKSFFLKLKIWSIVLVSLRSFIFQKQFFKVYFLFENFIFCSFRWKKLKNIAIFSRRIRWRSH